MKKDENVSTTFFLESLERESEREVKIAKKISNKSNLKISFFNFNFRSMKNL